MGNNGGYCWMIDRVVAANHPVVKPYSLSATKVTLFRSGDNR